MKTTREIHGGEARHSKRFAVTAIAIALVLAAVMIKAKLHGEFIRHIGC